MENNQNQQILKDIISQFKNKEKLPEKDVLAEDINKLIKDKFEIKEEWQINYKLDELIKILNDDYSSENDLNFKNRISEAIRFKIKTINGVSLKYRSIAFVIDIVAIAILGSIIPQSILNANHGLYSLIFFLLYFALLNYFFSSTIGEKILKIKLISGDEQKATFIQILFRELLFLTIFTGVGTIVYLINGFYWDKATKLKLIFENK
jgi:hypothetical protein